jgi:hypothetical protein
MFSGFILQGKIYPYVYDVFFLTTIAVLIGQGGIVMRISVVLILFFLFFCLFGGRRQPCRNPL